MFSPALPAKPVFQIFVATVVLLFTTVASAQGTKQKIKFASVNQLGLLIASKGEALAIQTINGVTKGKSFAGVGAAVDFYRTTSIPLFLDLRQDFSNRPNTPFAYIDGGVNFLWLTTMQKQQTNSAVSLPGYYYDLGVGWKLTAKNGNGFIISAGYSLKQAKYKERSGSISPIPGEQNNNYDHYNFLYRRLVVKIGFQL